MHAFKPNLFRYSDLTKLNSTARWSNALQYAKSEFDVNDLFSPEGIIVMY